MSGFTFVDVHIVEYCLPGSVTVATAVKCKKSSVSLSMTLSANIYTVLVLLYR